MTPIEFTVPLKILKGEAGNTREHPMAKHRRMKRQRLVTLCACPRRTVALRFELESVPLLVTMVRVAPSALDDDNNVHGLKFVRDQLTEWLGLKSDRDPRVKWVCAQERGGVREYGVRVRIEPRPACCPTCGAKAEAA